MDKGTQSQGEMKDVSVGTKTASSADKSVGTDTLTNKRDQCVGETNGQATTVDKGSGTAPTVVHDKAVGSESTSDGVGNDVDESYDPLRDSMNEGTSNTPLTSPANSDMPDAREGNRTPSPGPREFMVPHSPPKFVSLDQLLQVADGVSNMALAHEIAIDEDFHLQKPEVPENSLEKQVRDIMHRAFWDVLEEKLNETPPDYSQAMVLLAEVKEVLLDVLLPQHVELRTHINEVLDIELIRQQVEHNALDVFYYGHFVISNMAKLCAPARDPMVAALLEIKEVVPLFKEIFAALDVMKMDMANFTIQQIRPMIQKQSVEYERQKFREFLKTQEENNMDGIQYTKEWLTRNTMKLEARREAAAAAKPADGATPKLPPITPAAILNLSYLELMQWNKDWIFPETLVMDVQRFVVLRNRLDDVAFVSAILLITYNTVGGPIVGIKGLKEKLRDEIIVILGDTPSSAAQSVIINVAEHIIKEVNNVLKEHGFTTLDSSRQELLKGQVCGVVEPQHPVHKLITNRLMDFILEMISRTSATDMKLPPGVSVFAEELTKICGQFLRLITHNRSTFGIWYADVIEALLERHEDV